MVGKIFYTISRWIIRKLKIPLHQNLKVKKKNIKNNATITVKRLILHPTWYFYENSSLNM